MILFFDNLTGTLIGAAKIFICLYAIATIGFFILRIAGKKETIFIFKTDNILTVDSVSSVEIFLWRLSVISRWLAALSLFGILLIMTFNLII